jgi:hypothetical protein
MRKSFPRWKEHDLSVWIEISKFLLDILSFSSGCGDDELDWGLVPLELREKSE